MSLTFNRRSFLRTGSVVFALPFLESLAAEKKISSNKKLVAINQEFGFHGPAFFPENPGKDYKNSEYLEVLGDLRKDFTVFSGISHPEVGGDHASRACFLSGAKHVARPGFRNSVSLDFLAGEHIGSATRFPFMPLTTSEISMSYTKSGASIRAYSKPSLIYSKMFLAGSAKQVEKEIKRLQKGQSVMDGMLDKLKKLEGKLGNNDRTQLQDYTESVRMVEKRMVSDQDWIRKPKPTTKEPKPTDNPDKADTIGRTTLMLNMIRLALMSDSTRVCSLFMHGYDNRVPNLSPTDNHHGLTHHGNNKNKIKDLKVVEKAILKMFGKFLNDLKNTPDGESNLLDNTQVLIGSNLGNAAYHGTANLPILLAGGGYKHGQHIAGNVKKNTPLCNLFVTMLQNFGLEIESFGSSSGNYNGLV